MSAAHSTGPQPRFASAAETLHEQGSGGWTNIAPLERGAAGGLGEWIDLLARMSHDLRTPLNAVIGFSDAMHQELFGPIGNVRYEEYVKHIRSSGVELLQAAEDALTMTAVLAQSRSRHVEDIALAPIVVATIEELAIRGASRSVIIDSTVPRALEVRSDLRFLPRALRQLVAIAMARSATGASITIAATAQHGLVELAVHLSVVAADAPPMILAERAPKHELGLGRRDLALWLALALLDLMDCRLAIEQKGSAMTLRTTLEEPIQRDFFSNGGCSVA